MSKALNRFDSIVGSIAGGSTKLVGSGSSIVVFVKYGVIVQTPNPMITAEAITIIARVIFLNSSENSIK